MPPPPDPRAAGATLDDLGEAGILDRVFARLRAGGPDVLVGPGDDTALVRVHGPVLATTDTMVRGRDWRDEWSSAADVGAKVVVQNLADLSAMGGLGTALLVTLVAPGSLPAAWAEQLTEGVSHAADAAGVPVVGGDLSSSPDAVVVSVTALGVLPGPGPVLRSGAAPGQVFAVSEALGRSAAGLLLLQRSAAGEWPAPELADAAEHLVGYHCRPTPDLTQGPVAAAAGATALIDVSDGLARDAGRIASASGVRIDLDDDALGELARPLQLAVGAGAARECVLSGGEEHVLLGTFPVGAVPRGWTVLGEVSAPGERGPGVWCRDMDVGAGGWDHFGGPGARTTKAGT